MQILLSTKNTVILGLTGVGIVLFFVVSLTNLQIPIWYFQLKTFSFDVKTKISNREAACAAMSAPTPHVSEKRLEELFPTTFLANKNFFKVSYNHLLKQCVYNGLDIVEGPPIAPEPTVSFFLATAHLRECYVNPGRGWCTYASLANARAIRTKNQRPCLEPLFTGGYGTLLALPAPQKCAGAAITVTNQQTINSSGISVSSTVTTPPYKIGQTRYGSFGLLNDYEAIYQKFNEATAQYTH